MAIDEDGNDGHLAYLRQLLEARLAEGAAGEGDGPDLGPGEFLYLVRNDDGSGFWELVGVRVPGYDRAILGTIYFRTQSTDSWQNARRSLASFLTAPPNTLAMDRATFPAKLIEMNVPAAGEDVPDLLRRMKAGEGGQPLFIDAAVVQLAFDFRPGNPSIDRAGARLDAASQAMIFRTCQGHIFSGVAADLGSKMRRGAEFVGVTEVEQTIPTGSLPLPTLVLQRRNLAAIAEREDRALPELFSPQNANPCHLLDPRL